MIVQGEPDLRIVAPCWMLDEGCCLAMTVEEGDDFSGCGFFSLVAWNHVSWPGNDFFGGARCTDDGVKAAATDSMAVLTGVPGRHDPSPGAYQPPSPCHTWEDVVEMLGLKLTVWGMLRRQGKDRLAFYPRRENAMGRKEAQKAQDRWAGVIRFGEILLTRRVNQLDSQDSACGSIPYPQKEEDLPQRNAKISKRATYRNWPLIRGANSSESLPTLCLCVLCAHCG